MKIIDLFEEFTSFFAFYLLFSFFALGIMFILYFLGFLGTALYSPFSWVIGFSIVLVLFKIRESKRQEKIKKIIMSKSKAFSLIEINNKELNKLIELIMAQAVAPPSKRKKLRKEINKKAS